MSKSQKPVQAIKNPSISLATHHNEIEFCSFINDITEAIETGGVHAGPDFVPALFETADGFEKFLSEVDISYKRSVDRWQHSFQGVVEATDVIRRTVASR